MKYSPLRQIDRESVGRLEVAWTWDSGEEPVPGSSLAFRGERVRPGRLEGGRMTYQTSDGTQFLVIGVTGLGSDRRLIAFALPEG